MANDAKKTSQLGVATTLSANDRVVVLTNPASSAQTQTITITNFANAIIDKVQAIIPNTTVIANSVTIASNGTSNVAFFSYTIGAGKTGCSDITLHARDTVSDSTTAATILIVANNSFVSASVSSEEVGNNSILFTPSPVKSGNNIAVYFTRSAAATSNVNIRFAATIY